MPLAIDLLRHGDTGLSGFRGSLDDELAPLGWRQMEQTVAGYDWDVVVSSPRLRCVVFAQALAARCGLPLHVDERLAEMHFGAWEGKTAAELMQSDAEALKNFWQDPEHYSPPEGERMEKFSARVLQAWSDIRQQCAGQRVLVVTHGGVIRRILCHMRGLPLSELLSLEVAHGSLHRICADEAESTP